MSPSSAVHSGQYDETYVTFDLLWHATFVGDGIWGDMLEPARRRDKLVAYPVSAD